MAQHTTGKIRALGAVTSRWATAYVSDEISSYTEASPQPGTPRTDATLPRLAPQLTGAQAQPIELVVVSSGVPKAGGQGLQVGWRLEGEGVASIRGFTLPTHFVDVRMWGLEEGVSDYCSDDTATSAAWFPLSGRVAMFSGGHATNKSTFAVWNPHTDDFESEQILSPDTYDCPALAVVPGTERLLLLCSGNAWVSDDYGVGWSQLAGRGYEGASSGTPTYSNVFGRTRAAFDGIGNLLVVAQDTSAAPKTDFYASSDQGASWTEIARIDPTGTERLRWDITSHPSGAIFLALHDPNTAGVFVRRLGGAFTDPTTVGTGVEVGSSLEPATVQIACDENGALWVFVAGSVADAVSVRVYYSVDEGDTWVGPIGVDTGVSAPWLSASLVPCAFGGLCGVIAVGEDDDTTHTGSGRSSFVRLGGWTAPDRQDGGIWTGSAWWWAGVGDGGPAGVGWTAAVVNGDGVLVDGGVVGALKPYGYWELQNESGLAREINYTETITTDPTLEVSGEFMVRIVNDNGATSSNIPYVHTFELEAGDATAASGAGQRRWISIRMDEAGYRLRDENGGTWLGDKVLLDMTALPTAFRLSMPTTGGVQVMHCQIEDAVALDPLPVDRSVWTATLWAQPSIVTTLVSSASCRWGSQTPTASIGSHWWYVRARTGTADLVQGLSVTGIGLGSRSYPVPAGHDPIRERTCRLTLRGMGVTGDVYSVEPAYGYPVAAAFPASEPSPDVTWRSTATDADVVVAVSLTDDATAALGSHTEGEIAVAVVIRNANVQHVELRGYPAPGAPDVYTTIGTLDLATDTSGLTFSRTAGTDWLSPASGTAAARRFMAGELRGGFAVLDPDSAAGGPFYVKIRDNSAGWFDSTKGHRARIYLDGLDDGIHPTTGDVDLVYPSGVLIALFDAAYSHLGIAIAANEGTPDDYWEIGTAALCALIVPGKQWGHGRVRSLTPNVATSADDYGTERRSRRGPAPRTWEMSWDHGAKQNRVRSGDEWLGPSGATSDEALAGRDDVAGQIADLYATARDGELPVLVVTHGFPAMSGSTAVASITDPEAWLFGYLASDHRSVQARGDEGDDEFDLVGPLAIREIV